VSADEIYQAVTDRMVQALERGVVPWRTPWTLAGRPRPMSTGNAYRGVNTWLLALASRERGWGSPWFGTYRQIQELGGQVRQGEKSTLVTFWKTLEKEDRDPVTGEVAARAVPMLRKFRVFSACQADGLPARFFPEPGEERLIAGPQAVLDGYVSQAGGPGLRHDVQGQAYYSPAADEIHVPPVAGHLSPEHYYATAFHEAAHSTGHASRLGRAGITSGDAVFGSHEYGREELVAQVTASMLCAETGISTDEIFANSAAYVGGWLQTIRGDPRMVVSAAAAAQRATDLITEPSRQALAEPEPEPEPAEAGAEREIEAA
jgi:antirestriction protein ArdC